MIGERTNRGWEAELRTRGVGRLVPAAFLAFWLCGWLAGEIAALTALLGGAWALLTGRPFGDTAMPSPAGALAIGAFLILWLSLWTFGGFAAIEELLRLLWGRDHIVVAPEGLTLIAHRGPWCRTRSFSREAIRDVTLRGTVPTLVVETPQGTVELSRLGSGSERAELRDALRRELRLERSAEPRPAQLPAEWEEIITPEGERAVVPRRATRRNQAWIVGGLGLAMCAVVALALRAPMDRPGAIAGVVVSATFAGVCLWAAQWLALGRSEWRIGSGQLLLRRRYRSYVRDEFIAQRLVLRSRSDSDGDTWYQLDAESPDATKPRQVASTLHDPVPPRELGRWLASAAGLPFDDRAA